MRLPNNIFEKIIIFLKKGVEEWVFDSKCLMINAFKDEKVTLSTNKIF
jgi:hypothetical protein